MLSSDFSQFAQAAKPSVKVGLASFEHMPSHEAPLAQHVATPFLFTLHFSHCVAQAATPSAQVGLCSLEHLPSHDAPLTQHDEMPFQFTLHVSHEPGASVGAPAGAAQAATP